MSEEEFQAIGREPRVYQNFTVQEKISCVFDSIVIEEPTTKRNYQPYKVVAIDQVRQAAIDAEIVNAKATEKLDGTCVYIQTYRDIPWMWARHERKPSKAADKKFKKFQATLRAWQAGGEVGLRPVFSWDPEKDFKEVPAEWLPALGVEVTDTGVPLPDEGGHIFGWTPIDPRGRTHLWHASVVDLDAGVALVLQPCSNHQNSDSTSPQVLEITYIPLKDLVGSTMELIGTNINANPYKLGSKKQPFHVLVRHGSIPVEHLPRLDHESLTTFFQKPSGQLEGVVLYCPNGRMFKLHRHHLHQKWPLESATRLETTAVVVTLDCVSGDSSIEQDSTLYGFRKLSGQRFASLSELSDFWISTTD